MRFNVPGTPRPSKAPPSGFFTPRERNRLIGMGALLVVFVGAMLWWLISTGISPGADPLGKSRAEEAPASVVVTPNLRVERYRALARDSTREERAVVETEALEVALQDARLYSWLHFEPMGGVDATAELVSQLAADSQVRRGAIVRARGVIEALVEYPAVAGSSAHLRGRMRLDDGAPVFFAVLKVVDDYPLGVGDYVHVEGLFLKNQAELAPAGWAEGPLLVGPRIERSYPRMELPTAIAPQDFFEVEDDTSEFESATSSLDEYWKLVGYVAQLDPSTVDWSAAPLLDRAAMDQLSREPAAFRAIPMRIPPTQVQEVWTQRKGENPLRLGFLTEGWMGSNDWLRTDNPVVRFVSPRPDPGLRLRDEMTAKGYFLRMFRYEAQGGMRTAPLFVLATIEPWNPPKERVFLQVLMVVAGTFVVIVLAFVYLLRRDRKQAQQLDAELLRRRRMRRAGQQAQSR